MNEVEAFIHEHEGEQRAIMQHLHYIFVEELNLMDKIRYKIPFYYGRSWICYVNPTKNGGIELSFVRGNELFDEHGLLDARGRKQVSSVVFENKAAIPNNELKDLLQEALLLDEIKPYGSKRKSTK